jgi:hypothetical protein
MVSKRKIVEASYTDCRKITRRNLTNPDSLKVLKKIKGLFGIPCQTCLAQASPSGARFQMPGAVMTARLAS